MLRRLTYFLTHEIHQSYFLVALCIGVIGGTILGMSLRLGSFASPLWLAAVSIVILVAYFCPRSFMMIFALLAGAILALYKCSYELAGSDYIRHFYNQTVTVSGTIAGDPETEAGKTKFKLQSLRFGENGEHAAAGSLYVSVGSNGDLARGDSVTLVGKLTAGFGTYAGFMSRPEITHWARPNPGDLVLNVRNWFAARIERLIPDPQLRLGLSYLLGMKSGLPEELSENLRMVGLVHIVVASGAHLSILVEIARKVFGKLSRMTGVIFSIVFIIFFMALVGWTPSIMRAGIMSILTILAGFSGHTFAPWRIILLVAAFTLLINPMFLIDLGWLLSFASFIGIMILGPALTRFLYGNQKPKFIASMVLTTISATLMTLPIALYYYGTLSLISVVANLLILPTLPCAMGLVFATGVVGGLPFIETIVSFAATKLLDFHIAVVTFFGQMKSFMVEIDTNQPWVFALYLMLVPFLVAWFLQLFRRYKKHRQMAHGLAPPLAADLTTTPK